ncbi:protein of unknown function [Nitrosotalea devaniterrae]|uniref:Uncharacterized protein n=1 Tax=Nitrosotalea devaniterrae TaxID=1078905 RepID=A0A128A4Z6_9ARCH|nr:protein of unknown function [Candidatus Nitrosotalea devanaterra]
MVDILSSVLAKELVTRCIAITAIFSIISYFIIRRYQSKVDNLKTKLPLLFVIFGVVILINILYVLSKNT